MQVPYPQPRGGGIRSFIVFLLIATVFAAGLAIGRGIISIEPLTSNPLPPTIPTAIIPRISQPAAIVPTALLQEKAPPIAAIAQPVPTAIIVAPASVDALPTAVIVQPPASGVEDIHVSAESVQTSIAACGSACSLPTVSIPTFAIPTPIATSEYQVIEANSKLLGGIRTQCLVAKNKAGERRMICDSLPITAQKASGYATMIATGFIEGEPAPSGV